MVLHFEFLLFVVLIPTGLAEEVYVDSGASISQGSDYSCGDRSSPCPTLETALNRTASESVATVVILSDTLILRSGIVRDNSTVFHLRGSERGGTLITCSSSSSHGLQPGLVFVGLDNVTISRVNFTNCGTLRTYEIELNTKYEYMAAIHFHLCRNVTLHRVNLSGNRGAGLAIIDPQGGTISIEHSQFSWNRVPSEYVSKYYGGVGVYVRDRREGKEEDQVRLQLSHCTFEHNQATFPYSFYILNVYNGAHLGSGRGGGLDVILWYNASWNDVTVSDCRFYNNTAYLGGGLAIQLYDDIHHNNFTIVRCTFERNGCVEEAHTGSGGGAHFGYSFLKSFEPLNNNFVVKDSLFRENCAELGGGMTFFASRSNDMETALSNVFLLDNCTWVGNTAHVGAAVDMSPHVYDRVKEGFLPTLVFKDSVFIGNKVAFHQLEFYQSFGSGAVFSSLFNVDFVGFARFWNNSGSAFVIVNAIANFSECDAEFVGNTGVQGGAISLAGISSLIVGPGKTYNFTENEATDRGGAIYNYLIDDHDFIASRSCFLYYSNTEVPPTKWTATFNFIGNVAGTYGHSIFSSSILSCVRLVPSESNLHVHGGDTSIVFRWPRVFNFDERTENQIATEGGYFTTTDSLPFYVIPGEEHKLEISITDDNGQEVEVVFRASVIDSSTDTVDVGDAFSCVSGNTIQMKGDTDSTGVLLLETISSRKNSIAMNITLLPCPPGFVLTGNECTCSIETYSAIVGCDLRNFRSSIKVGYWAGYIDNQTFVTGICPLHFCEYNNTHYEREIPLPKITSPSHLDEYICGPTRTGILCGSCKPGYSVFYHSPGYSCHRSQHCDWGWLFYILSELVPVTLLFVTVLGLNISFTSGNINGFILFSQLLDSVIVNGSGVVQYPRVLSTLSWGYQLIYGVFTMEFFSIEPLSFCLWEGATVLDVLAFRYVTIIYAFLLVLVTLLFIKNCGHAFAGKYLRITAIKSSIVHGLSAFIILCYAQFTKISIFILLSAYVRGENGDVISSQVFFSGDTGVYSIEHLPYAFPAIVVLMTLTTFPPALLLLYPSANKFLAFFKVSDKKAVVKVSQMIPISKIKPFLDSFQGCFKDNLRFFAGVYFVYRWIALMMFALVPTITGFYISLGSIYILVLLLHAIFQPYTNRAHNIVDGCLFANLALIYSIAGFNYIFSQGLIESFAAQSKYVNSMASIQLILIYLPIVGMAVYLGSLLWHKRCLPKREERIPVHELSQQSPTTVTSSDIDELLEEFPARLLESEYNDYFEQETS